MSRESDRVSVPTNGHAPPLRVTPTESPAPAGAARAAKPAAPSTVGDTAEPPRPRAGTALPDMRIAVSPAQAAAGFGIIAGLILLVLGRRGRRR